MCQELGLGRQTGANTLRFDAAVGARSGVRRGHLRLRCDKSQPIRTSATAGEILQDEIEALGLSANALSRALGVPVTPITATLHGQRCVTEVGLILSAAHSLPSLARVCLIRDWLRAGLAYGSRSAQIRPLIPTAPVTRYDVPVRSELDIMAPVPGAADRTSSRFPDQVVVVLGTNECVRDLMKNRIPNLVARCVEAKEVRHANHSGAVSAASSLSRGVVELETPSHEAVLMDESFG